MRIEAVLLDLDGTLADSEPAIRSAQREALLRLGHSLPENMWEGLEGVPFYDPNRRNRLTALGVPSKDQGSADREYRQLLRERLGQTPKMDGADDLLRALASSGLKLAVVSNKPTAGAFELIEALGWEGIFEVVVGRDTDGASPKPDPATVLIALGRLGVAASSSSFVGDSVLDMQAASAAGCAMVVGISASRSCKELLDAGASDCCRALSDAKRLLLAARGGR